MTEQPATEFEREENEANQLAFLLESGLFNEKESNFSAAASVYKKARHLDAACIKAYLGEVRSELQLKNYGRVFAILEKFYEESHRFDARELALTLDELLPFASPLFLSDFNRAKAEYNVLAIARLVDRCYFDLRQNYVFGEVFIDFYRLSSFCSSQVALEIRGLLAPVIARSHLREAYGTITQQMLVDPHEVVFLIVGQMRGYAEAAKQFSALRQQGSEILVVTWEKSGFRLPTFEPGTVWHLNRTFPSAVTSIFAEYSDDLSVLLPMLTNVKNIFEQNIDILDVEESFETSKLVVESEEVFEQDNNALIDRILQSSPIYGQNSSPINSAKMIYLNHRADEALTQFEKTRGKSFKYVFRCRPDVIIDFERYPVDRIAIDLLLDERSVVIDHHIGHPLPLCGDRLSFSGRNSHRIYSSLWTFWQAEVQAVGHALHGTFSHTRLADFLTYQNLSIRPRSDMILHYDGSHRVKSERLRFALQQDLQAAPDERSAFIINKIISVL